MTDSPIIPGSHSKPIKPDGAWQHEWFSFLRSLAQNVKLSADQSAAIAALADRVTALESVDDLGTIFQGLHSIIVTGSTVEGVVIVALKGDEATPGDSHYYGTDETGSKGWYERLLATLADVDVSTPPVTGDALVYDGAVWKPGAVDTSVPYFVPPGETYTVAINKQALFSMPIDCEGLLAVDGFLVEVD